MKRHDDELAAIAFASHVVEWRGPAPFLFAPVPQEHTGEILYAARAASYGWGMVPVEATTGATRFTTSLFRRGDRFMLPLKIAVQRAEGLTLGAPLAVQIVIRAR